MRLGEDIRWAPLGPGGDPQMSLQGCGCGGPALGAAPIVQMRRGGDMRRLADKREMYRHLRGRSSTGLGEVIRWAPLGPGGDPQMSLQGLRGLSPENQQSAEGAMSQLEITDQQVYNEIAEAYASGVSEMQIAAYEKAYDGLLDRLIAAQTNVQSASDDQWAALADEITQLQADYQTLLSQLLDARESRRYGNRMVGLAWGLGAAAAAAGVLWWAWRRRKRR